MNDNVMNDSAGDLWWLGVVAGVVTILFGIAALFWPGLTLVTFIYLFSAYVLVWGVVSLIKSFTRLDSLTGTWWLSFLFGILAIGVGIYLVRHPGTSFATLILLTGFTFIIRGIFDVLDGLFGGRTGGGKAMAVIAGVIGVVAGVFVLMQPVSGGIAYVWILGLYALIFGPLLIAMSMEEHSASEVAPAQLNKRKV